MIMMSSKYPSVVNNLRRKFKLANTKAIEWFPGHMQRGLLQIQAKLKSIDCIIEIHDARIPFSGRNLRLRDIITIRPHILLLNKVDLTNLDHDGKKSIEKTLHSQGVDTVFFTNLRDGSKNANFLKQEILPTMKHLADSRPRYTREGLQEYNMLVLGVPNVGKSTFINSLRSTALKKAGKATTTGATAGVTRSVLSRIKVDVDPLTYVFDTPGIIPPKIPGLETGMRLAACACVPEHIVGKVNIADYILYWMNKRGHFQYVEAFNLSEPTDNILDVLAKIAIANKKVIKVKNMATNELVYRPDNEFAAELFYSAFREGKLGKYVLDDDFAPSDINSSSE